eukprot:CAMPEP_0171325458 /NCGR_PEP_ID=MMETSP0816-20121228/116818_1 /TAXON_ID=420281 /ORGANISM="Proboscia inermis, Strain CCAP1064/1" /LENGTH=203 /DNA_ID=CAMNT_0011824633 /DNA_START=119 /DNA_END=730 /DNA_ORIENTATION=+
MAKINLVTREKKRPEWCNNENLSGIAIMFFLLFLFLYSEEVSLFKAHEKKKISEISKAGNEQLSNLAASLQGKQKALGLRSEGLKEKISDEKDTLIADLEEYNEIVVSEEATEESAIAATDLKEEIETLEVLIEEDKESLDVVTTDLEKVTVDSAKFCDECEFNYSGLGTLCGLRKNYLMTVYSNTEEAAKAAVAQWDPNCMK